MRFLQRMRMALLSLSSVCLLTAAAPGVALAATPFDNVDCGRAASSAVCADRQTTTNPLTGNDGVLIKVTDIIALIAGAGAVVIILLSGFQFITSGGSKDGAANARKSLIYAVVGLVIIVSARTIITYVLSKF